MCSVLKISRSAYYSWTKNQASKIELKNKPLIEEIKKIFIQNRKLYGYRSIYNALCRQGKKCSKNRVARLMKIEHIRPKTVRKFRVTTNSKHNLPVAQNKLNRQFNVKDKNHSWVSDITYIATQEGWLYLAVIIDLFSRKIIGWSMNNRMEKSLVCNALKMALFRRKITSETILHSDRGSQYCSKIFQQLLVKNNIICSMSRKGNCWDNAVAESFFSTLKKECVFQNNFRTRQEAKREIFEYIEVFYNKKRRHSFLGYLSPEEFEKNAINL